MHNRNPTIDPHIFHLIDKQVEQVTVGSDKQMTLNFSAGFVLVVGIRTGKLTAKVRVESAKTHKNPDAPTKRQLEYLLFISKYLQHYGRAPAESDIERHFLVSAPSVNQMMQTLERRGFISRQPKVPRSTKITVDLGPFGVS